MNDVNELLKWCEQARSLLGWSLVSKSGDSLDKAIAAVKSGLSELVKMPSQTGLYTSFLTQFDALATRARELGPDGGSKLVGTARKDAVKALVPEFTKLGAEIKAALPLAQAQEKYLSLLDKCRTQRDIQAHTHRAEVATLDNLIATAKTLAGNETDAAALLKAAAELGTFDAACDAVIKATAAAAQQAKLQTAARPDCLKALEAAKQLLAHVQRHCVGIDDKIKKIADAIGAAQPLVDAGDFVEAAKKLKSLPSGKDCESASASVLKKLGDPRVAEAREQLQLAQPLLPESDWAELELRLNAAINAVANGVPDAGRAELEPMLFVLQSRVNSGMAARQELTVKIGKLELEAAKLRTLAPTVEVVAAERRLEAVQALVQQREWLQAQAAAQLLAVELKASYQVFTAAKQRWTALAAGMGLLRERLQGQAADQAAPADAVTRAARAAFAVSAKSVQELLDARDWTALTELHARYLAEAEAFDAGKRSFDGYAAERAAAVTRIAPDLARAKQLLDELISKAGGDKEIAAAEQASLQLIESGWAQRQKNAGSAKELGEAATREDLAGVIAALERLGSLAGLAEAQSRLQQLRDEAEVKREAERVRGALPALSAFDGGAAADFAKRIEALTQPPQDWEEARSALDTLEDEIAQAQQAAERDSAERIASMKTRCQSLSTELEARWADARKGKGARFKPHFDALREELADLTTLAETTSLEAGKANQAILDELAQRLAALQTGEGSEDPFAQVLTELARLEVSYNDAAKTLKANVPKRQAVWQEAFNAFKTELYGMEPKAAFDEFCELRLELNLCRGEAYKVDNLRKVFDDQAATLDGEIRALVEAGKAPAYAKSLKPRLAAIRKQAENPDQLLTARQRLDALVTDVQNSLADPLKALALQQKMQEEDERKALLAVEWKHSLEVFNNRVLPAARKAVAAPGADASQVDELQRMLETAEKSASAKDHVEALRLLRLCEQRAAEIERDPSGPGIGSRAQLPQDAMLYAQTMRDWLSCLDEAPDAISAGLAEAGDPVKAAVRAKLEASLAPLKRQFNPALFDLYAIQLSDGKQDAKLRRAAREAALVRVRELRALLLEHPALAGLLVNPVWDKPRLLSRELQQRLGRLEANVRRCVH